MRTSIHTTPYVAYFGKESRFTLMQDLRKRTISRYASAILTASRAIFFQEVLTRHIPIHNKNYQTAMNTKCVTYTSFNADYLAVPNNLLTHTHTGKAYLFTSIKIRAHPRAIYGFSCICAREAGLFFVPANNNIF